MNTSIAPMPACGHSAAESALLADAAALAGIAAWSCDLASETLNWTRGVFDLFGFEPGQRPDRSDALRAYGEPYRAMLERVRTQAIASCLGFTMEAKIRHADGSARWMRIAANTEIRNGRAIRLYGMKQDITAEKAQWEQLRKLAEHDALTGLANRARFHADFLDLPAASEALSRVGALVLIDLDDFKIINDRLGHAAGDRYISSFGQRLAAAFPQALLVTRIGGDEFAVVLPALLSPPMAERLVRRRIPALAAPLHTPEWTLPIGFSAGLAFNHPACRASPDALFAAADEALYAAKRCPGTSLCLAAGAGLPKRRRA